MIGGLAARWMLTVVFAAAGLTAGLPPLRRLAGSAQTADRVSAVFCGVLCAALIAMRGGRSRPPPRGCRRPCPEVPRSGSGWPAWLGRVRLASRPAVLHALMAGAMIWMLTSMPAGAGMASAGPARAAMASMSRAVRPAPAVAVSVLFAVGCAAASIRWPARAVGTGSQLKDPIAASQAAMSAGMAAMLLGAAVTIGQEQAASDR